MGLDLSDKLPVWITIVIGEMIIQLIIRLRYNFRELSSGQLKNHELHNSLNSSIGLCDFGTGHNSMA